MSFSAGCSLIDYYFLPPPEDTPQEIYEVGVEAMKEKDYSGAAEYFAKLKDNFPFSPYAPRAEVGLGDAYFLDEEYLAAIDAYKEFEALHPEHEDAAYVLYQIGLSNMKLFKSIDLRQENIKEALEYFYRLEEEFPSSDYSDPGRTRIVECRNILAEHELYVADFFWRSKKYGPSWNRYLYIIKEFQDLPKVIEYAKRRAKYSYFEYQKTLSQKEREEIEGSWKDWFEWL